MVVSAKRKWFEHISATLLNILATQLLRHANGYGTITSIIPQSRGGVFGPETK